LPVVSDIAAYEVAQSEQKTQQLQNYAMRQKALYKDLAVLQSALIYLQNNEIKKAKEELALINDKSSVKNVAQALEHYGVE
jgi:chaperonin cofactor prefoldin